MNKFTTMTIAGLLAASVSTIALADAEADAEAEVEADIDSEAEAEVEADPVAGAEDAEAPEFGDVVSSVEGEGDAAAEVDAISDDAAVSVHGLPDLQGDAEAHTPALDGALVEREERILQLHSAVRTRVSLNAALEAAGYTADDLVAVIVNTDGSVRLIVDNR